jgi:hypothetical protein
MTSNFNKLMYDDDVALQLEGEILGGGGWFLVDGIFVSFAFLLLALYYLQILFLHGIGRRLYTVIGKGDPGNGTQECTIQPFRAHSSLDRLSRSPILRHTIFSEWVYGVRRIRIIRSFCFGMLSRQCSRQRILLLHWRQGFWSTS